MGIKVIEITTERVRLFELNHVKLDNGCWLWEGSHDIRGYSTMDDPRILIHRLSYLIENPDYVGKLTNVCGDVGCVNPSHWKPRVKVSQSKETALSRRNRKDARDRDYEALLARLDEEGKDL